jgi:hypothetical protein
VTRPEPKLTPRPKPRSETKPTSTPKPKPEPKGQKITKILKRPRQSYIDTLLKLGYSYKGSLTKLLNQTTLLPGFILGKIISLINPAFTRRLPSQPGLTNKKIQEIKITKSDLGLGEFINSDFINSELINSEIINLEFSIFKSEVGSGELINSEPTNLELIS